MTRPDVTRLATKPCPGFISVTRCDIVSATRRALSNPPTAITMPTPTSAVPGAATDLADEQECRDLRRIVDAAGEAHRTRAQVVQRVEHRPRPQRQERPPVAHPAGRLGPPGEQRQAHRNEAPAAPGAPGTTPTISSPTQTQVSCETPSLCVAETEAAGRAARPCHREEGAGQKRQHEPVRQRWPRSRRSVKPPGPPRPGHR